MKLISCTCGRTITAPTSELDKVIAAHLKREHGEKK